MKLNVVAAGLAFGIFWAMGVVGVVAIHVLSLSVGPGGYAGYGADFIRIVGSVYPGYSASVGGAAIGAVWALVDGFISVAVFAHLYNIIAVRIAGK